MKITYYGHSCFQIDLADKVLLFDPFIRANELAKDVDINEIKPDYILITHGHQDHVADAEQIAKNSGATIISNFEIVSWYENKGIQGHPMNFGGRWSFDFGTVHYVQAVHSSVLPDGTYGGNPGGFIIESQETTFYYAGDTALFYDMKLWGEKFNFDFIFLPIGDNFTMGVDDAITASDFLKCNQVVGMHYDTFGFIKINHEQALNAFKAKDKNLTLFHIASHKLTSELLSV